ncbi:MAG: hypothetical protein ACI9SP_001498 [Arenicella sp.]|jgi:hypothetical protein
MKSKYVVLDLLPVDQYTNCEGVLDDHEGFRILARGEHLSSPMYRISFDVVEAYSSVEEASSFNDSRRSAGFGTKDCCFIVEDSWYLAELHQISSGVRENDDINHYAFYFSNQCIDVLAYGKPKVENLND